MSFAIDNSAGLAARAALASLLVLTADAVMAQTITGTAMYRERIALPPDAVLEATLEDVTRADAKADTIAQARIPSPGNPPIAFSITYDPAKIASDRRYVVRAKILVKEKLLFVTNMGAPVITRGSPTDIKLMMRMVGSAPQTAPDPAGAPPGPAQPPPAAGAGQAAPSGESPLTGTTWQLVKFEGGDGKVLTPDDRTKYTIEFSPGWQVSARIDCNRGHGAWKSSAPNHLQFGPLALTRAMCPPESMHDQIVKQWSNIRSYVIKDGHLFLSLMADGGIYELEPIKKTNP
jgi:uncharacterized lipoprotein YbaY